jgi:hypothetical protein
MNPVQTLYVQFGSNVPKQMDLEEQRELQSTVRLKVFSFLRCEDRNAVMRTCREWHQVLYPQIKCARLLELVQAYRREVPEGSSEFAEVIGNLEAQLLRRVNGSNERVYQENWHLFYKQCSAGVYSVVWSFKLFKDHHFLRLFGCIALSKQIEGKGALDFGQSDVNFVMKQMLQVQLIRKFVACDHPLAAVETYVEMEHVHPKLGMDLIRICRAKQDDDLVVRVGKKIELGSRS